MASLKGWNSRRQLGCSAPSQGDAVPSACRATLGAVAERRTTLTTAQLACAARWSVPAVADTAHWARGARDRRRRRSRRGGRRSSGAVPQYRAHPSARTGYRLAFTPTDPPALAGRHLGSSLEDSALAQLRSHCPRPSARGALAVCGSGTRRRSARAAPGQCPQPAGSGPGERSTSLSREAMASWLTAQGVPDGGCRRTASSAMSSSVRPPARWSSSRFQTWSRGSSSGPRGRR